MTTLPAAAALTSLTSPWRDLWPVVTDTDRIYLNGAGEGPSTTFADEELLGYLANKRFPHHKDITRAFWVPKKIRELGAWIINGDPAGAGVVTSTNVGINILAQGYGWQPGDRVLLFAGEFPACVYPFLLLKARGIEVDFCPLDVNGIPRYDLLDSLITPRTRMLVASWVQFFNGFTHDIPRLKAACATVDALLAIDVSQGVGLATFDATAWGVDAVAYSGHKTLCAPVGSGIFWLDPKHADRIPATYLGWVSQMPNQDFNDLVRYQILPDVDGRRFETGSDIQVVWRPFLAMLEWWKEVGVAPLAAHVTALVDALEHGLRSRGCPTQPPPGSRISILVFRAPDGGDTAGLFQRLWDAGVVCSLREGWIRISPHVFNDGSDIARFFGVLDRVL